MAKKLTKKDASGAVTQWGIQIPSDGNTGWLFTGNDAGNAVRLNNEQGTRFLYDDPKVIEAVQNWYDLSKRRLASPDHLLGRHPARLPRREGPR